MICPICKAQVGDGSKFCNMCGADLRQPESQPQPEQTAQLPPEPQPQPEQTAQIPPEPQPQPEQTAQIPPEPQPQQWGQTMPQNTQPSENDIYAQQFREYQQSNAQYANPAHARQNRQPVNQGEYLQRYNGGGEARLSPADQPYNGVPVGYQPAQPQPQPKKSKLPLILALAGGGVAIIAVAVVVLLLFTGKTVGVNNIVNDFTSAVNESNVSYIQKYAFDEDKTTLDISQILGYVPASVKVRGQQKSVETYIKGDSNFDRFAESVADSHPSVGGAQNVIERQIVEGEFKVTLLGYSQNITLYFDMACVNGEWKCVDTVAQKSGLDYYN